MCKTTAKASSRESDEIGTSTMENPRTRRRKRDKEGTFVPFVHDTNAFKSRIKKKSKSLQKHGKEGKSGGVEALLPSLIGLAILVCGAMAKMGFRGRASVAGIDLGTTNSVICVQQPSKTVGEIVCMPDPVSNSPIIPSVVSFLEKPRKLVKNDKSVPLIDPDPSHVVVGREAKQRIDTHPHHTLFNAKRVLGRRHTDDAVQDLRNEVEFDIVPEAQGDSDSGDNGGVMFRVPHQYESESSSLFLKPQQVGSYIVHHLMEIAKLHLGHENVKTAVIAVPAKFNAYQRQMTVEAFKIAGVTVSRILEEPTAAALAYGLDKKENVDYILVYDFGGGTLDVSLLHVSDDGFVDVMGSDGDDRLGGADFDAAVAHFLLQKHGGQNVVDRVSRVLEHFEQELEVTKGGDLEEGLDTACPLLRNVSLCTVSSFHTIGEKMKIELSSSPQGNVEVHAECLSPPSQSSMPATLADFCNSLQPYPLTLTSSQYNDLAQVLFDRSKIPIERLLNDLGLRKNEVDEVVMVGGTTRMPQIRQLVKDALDMDSLNTHIDPDLTVAYGAASVID